MKHDWSYTVDGNVQEVTSSQEIFPSDCPKPLGKSVTTITEVDNLQGIYPLKDEWVFGCSLKTRLADQTKRLNN